MVFDLRGGKEIISRPSYYFECRNPVTDVPAVCESISGRTPSSLIANEKPMLDPVGYHNSFLHSFSFMKLIPLYTPQLPAFGKLPFRRNMETLALSLLTPGLLVIVIKVTVSILLSGLLL